MVLDLSVSLAEISVFFTLTLDEEALHSHSSLAVSFVL